VPVLYLAPWVDLGGSDKGTIDWFKHIDRTRWAPSLIATQPSPNRWLHKLEPYAEEVWDLPDLMPGASFPAFILGFIESRGVKVVHIMNSRLGFDLLPDMTCLSDPPAVVVQMHAEEPDKSGYVRYATRRYGNLVDAFSVTSEQLKQAVVGYDIPPSKVHVIHSGVDAEREFDPARVEPLELPGNGAPRILWPGRLVDQKDPLLTLDVAARVRARGIDFVLDVVGDGELAPALRMRAEKLGLADAVCWHPPAQDMAPWYRSADLLLMTSVFEGVPYVVYESLAMGVPVVAPALPGNREFMDADSGALVEPRDDVDQYATAVATLLEDRERRHAMGRRSRARMLSEFSLSGMGSRHDALYERLLDRPRPAAARIDPAAPADPTARADPTAAPAPATIARQPAPDPPPAATTLFSRDPPPRRSVGAIVPCHRHGIYLAECVESIKAQTLAPVAIVVVDDGSDDPETVAALARLDDDPAVTVLRQPHNLGPSAARNRALAQLAAEHDPAYVLPLDADDVLLPDALERMVAQLEAAPPDVGYVYPSAQHSGNRSDFVPSPAYNLWLLMSDNYCPAPALFDRRAFEAGVEYPEDMVFGHEDWDLLLQLAELGIRGEHVGAPTFLYRKYGFSRINAVEYGPHAFHKQVERRHPALYRNSDTIKGRWAPALSIVLLDDDAVAPRAHAPAAAGPHAWQPDDLAGLPRQSCADFEIVAPRPLSRDVRVATPPGDDDKTPAARLQACISAARGRWVCVLTPRALPALRDPSLVERLVYGFWAHERTCAIVLGEAPGIARAAFSQLTDDERLDAEPVALAYERVPEQPAPPVELGQTGSPLVDMLLDIQARGPVQWRLAPATAPAAPATGSLNGHAELNGHAPLDSAPPPPNAPTTLTLDPAPARDRSEQWVQRSLSWQAPRLPGLTPGAVRRWETAATWIPPETATLTRHRAGNGEDWVVTTGRDSPPGYRIEFDLGVVHRFAFPGTRRLVEQDGSFALTDDEGELIDGRRGFGYVEQAPLPMLEVLELRRMPESGRHVLVAGVDDPLYDIAEPVAALGWIEAFPIQPRRAKLHVGPWGAVALRRYVDRDAWRHRYRTGAPGDEPDGVSLGSLLREPGDALVALRLRPDGRLESDLAAPSRAAATPRAAVRWVAAPLTWASGPPPAWAQRAAASRARRLLSRGRRANGASPDPHAPLGWLRRTSATGYTALLSATHPITGDQLVTRSELEATDLGYRVDGVLGHIFDAGVDHPSDLEVTTVLWGSRFGKGRRYAEA
jgi:glycosyltransferase involved in cell wall biosynthesis